MKGKVYCDSRGWHFKVMPGLGDDMFKARYNKPGKPGWHCVAVLPWRVLRARAEADLAYYAKKKGMTEVKEDDL